MILTPYNPYFAPVAHDGDKPLHHGITEAEGREGEVEILNVFPEVDEYIATASYTVPPLDDSTPNIPNKTFNLCPAGGAIAV